MSFANVTPPANLLEMLRFKRPHGSEAENEFIHTFIFPHIDHVDQAGNLWKEVGDNPTILWSSHTDTVHRTDGIQGIEYSTDGWILPELESTECLGADCTAGIWLMIEMIKAKVPGVYVFHRGEECGGIGSSHISSYEPHLLDGLKAAIAFDRKAFTSVITHQFAQRCCSDEFADSLISILGISWKKDDTGSFTDTANYVDDIGECTNISVGYLDQHTSKERLHFPFLVRLKSVLIAADWSKLVFKREPGEVDPDWKDYSRFYSSSAYGSWESDYEPYYKSTKTVDKIKKIVDHPGFRRYYSPNNDDDISLLEYVRHNPERVAEMLASLGYTTEDLECAELNNDNNIGVPW